MGCLWDEPFTPCDVQFDYPQVAILLPAPIKKGGKGLPIIGILYANAGPAAIAIGLRHSFPYFVIAAFFAGHDHDRAAVPLAAGQNRGKAAFRFDPADKAGNLDMGGKPRPVHQVR